MNTQREEFLSRNRRLSAGNGPDGLPRSWGASKRRLFEAYKFFREHGGGVVGENAKGALASAKAEARAKALGLEFRWEPDDDADLGDHEEWCNDARVAKAIEAGRPVDRDRAANVHVIRGCEHIAEWCGVYAPGAKGKGDFLASLGGILDAGNDYRRVVEAELASEALDEWDKREAEKRTDEALRAEAKELYHEEGQIEIEDDAEVSLSEKGAYVQAWVFVPKEG